MEHQNENELNIVIAGGGPGGLLAAILLRNMGISSTVLERSSEPDQWSSKSYTIVLGDRGKGALEKAGCLDAVADAGIERKFMHFFDAEKADMMSIPKKRPGIGFTRPLLVECLEKIANEKPGITLKKGVGVEKVAAGKDGGGLCVGLEDGTTISATHVIGADGKWSKVRQSFPEINSQAAILTCPAFGVHLDCPTVPEGWTNDGTYIIKPAEECDFYVLASPRPSDAGLSISMVVNDNALEKYPWLTPPDDMKPEEYGLGGWEDEYSAMPKEMKSEESLSTNIDNLFREVLPAFHALLEKEVFESARINRRVTWLKMTPKEGEDVTYTTKNGRVTLLGDAGHAMTPSMGEGCNTALESATRLADCIAAVMEKNEDKVFNANALTEAFQQYGLDRPKETISIQEISAERNMLKKK